MSDIVECLSSCAAEFDLYIPELVHIYLNLQNVPEEGIQGVLWRQNTIDSPLNSADIGMELWEHKNAKADFMKCYIFASDIWRSADILVEDSVRRQRPQTNYIDQETKSTLNTGLLQKDGVVQFQGGSRHKWTV